MARGKPAQAECETSCHHAHESDQDEQQHEPDDAAKRRRQQLDTLRQLWVDLFPETPVPEDAALLQVDMRHLCIEAYKRGLRTKKFLASRRLIDMTTVKVCYFFS